MQVYWLDKIKVQKMADEGINDRYGIQVSEDERVNEDINEQCDIQQVTDEEDDELYLYQILIALITIIIILCNRCR